MRVVVVLVRAWARSQFVLRCRSFFSLSLPARIFNSSDACFTSSPSLAPPPGLLRAGHFRLARFAFPTSSTILVALCGSPFSNVAPPKRVASAWARSGAVVGHTLQLHESFLRQRSSNSASNCFTPSGDGPKLRQLDGSPLPKPDSHIKARVSLPSAAPLPAPRLLLFAVMPHRARSAAATAGPMLAILLLALPCSGSCLIAAYIHSLRQVPYRSDLGDPVSHQLIHYPLCLKRPWSRSVPASASLRAQRLSPSAMALVVVSAAPGFLAIPFCIRRHSSIMS